ncbi:MAG: hypothetical protein RML47_09155 [Bacteroidota bacterium]|nr:hypothetical protein [Rhodothermia bacterium]MCS7156084.1 hypothetical protein [Bacteroidota bacterium]MDW8137901.1 hypothetical protein [Bacteroidota bacterium]MDW8286248.1 hypothetical protein [Bacteroidota bacterium]
MEHTKPISGLGEQRQILERIEQLRRLFSLGQEILPFLEQLFVFLKEVAPLMSDLSRSVFEGSLRMPEATSEIETIHAKTSDATFRILERTEQLLAELETLQAGLRSEEGSEPLAERVDRAYMAALDIMTSLQFHDIVTQKLAAVRDVLTRVQNQLIELFENFQRLEIDTQLKHNLMAAMGIREEELEQILALRGRKPAPKVEVTISQADIDALFS